MRDIQQRQPKQYPSTINQRLQKPCKIATSSVGNLISELLNCAQPVEKGQPRETSRLQMAHRLIHEKKLLWIFVSLLYIPQNALESSYHASPLHIAYKYYWGYRKISTHIIEVLGSPMHEKASGMVRYHWS